MTVAAKICGLSEPESLRAAVAGGARYVGFVFYPRSPRAIAPPMAAELARLLPTGVRSVGLFVDPDDEFLEHVTGQVPLDLIQLHGSETPRRIAEIKARYALPVMKAVKIGGPEDLTAALEAAEVADRLLFDAKPPAKVSALPGGNGIAFDWTILAGRRWPRPWMLSGGLTVENVAEAVRVTGAAEVDVSSGVEDRPGHKDPALVRAFLSAVAAL
ncbi:phosphoribosylanthranilate isomerase [Azospirillum lipoferum]|uniref:N-(5'-phosphoribosyl)anthranilate isomerase n=1 Tax=Azospirillum lipoferum TaxID=193 RepID=A0A5A9GVQ9_AZOLI|nr:MULTISPECIES: phosphoribosylanthranilate isomerase [Azospirillum]KAA0597862.1 phosphoribosylanthranilate isomerase [Azospirillum lipoferum]MCP1609997.1 phosphoribosylanthranilate isomerase [Azospirillum lipoferum]MDW5534510.1 phosphoribosylanthranilate isomerase [Azospirillum sp. NL1]